MFAVGSPPPNDAGERPRPRIGDGGLAVADNFGSILAFIASCYGLKYDRARVRHIMSSDSTTLFINRSSDNHAPALAENSLSSPLISPFIAASLGVDTVSVVELLIQLVHQDLECVSALPDELNSSADQMKILLFAATCIAAVKAEVPDCNCSTWEPEVSWCKVNINKTGIIAEVDFESIKIINEKHVKGKDPYIEVQTRVHRDIMGKLAFNPTNKSPTTLQVHFPPQCPKPDLSIYTKPRAGFSVAVAQIKLANNFSEIGKDSAGVYANVTARITAVYKLGQEIRNITEEEFLKQYFLVQLRFRKDCYPHFPTIYGVLNIAKLRITVARCEYYAFKNSDNHTLMTWKNDRKDKKIINCTKIMKERKEKIEEEERIRLERRPFTTVNNTVWMKKACNCCGEDEEALKRWLCGADLVLRVELQDPLLFSKFVRDQSGNVYEKSTVMVKEIIKVNLSEIPQKFDGV
ncbi:unnamed protein product [Cylicocyclus nassatus]|uniref:Uncharacterized protein n=1 Tax=Cylicocyclus nassatus TaxID=53992 RepID=A0AA36M824_CYLNA|nr:unnamed protein product [Cylicocyclus nassatus]